MLWKNNQYTTRYSRNQQLNNARQNNPNKNHYVPIIRLALQPITADYIRDGQSVTDKECYWVLTGLEGGGKWRNYTSLYPSKTTLVRYSRVCVNDWLGCHVVHALETPHIEISSHCEPHGRIQRTPIHTCQWLMSIPRPGWGTIYIFLPHVIRKNEENKQTLHIK
jgi:hypothetical protein